jgi:hypothetical protein
MKKIILISILILLIMGPIYGQTQNEVTLTSNYVIVPHNFQQGAGYSFGFNHQLSPMWWLNTEFSYNQSMREKFIAQELSGYTLLPLTYMLSGYYLTVAPNIRLQLAPRLEIRFGVGPSTCYQSLLSEKYHYTIPDGYFGEEEISGNDFWAGYRLRGMSNLQVGVNFRNNWSLILNGAYSYYFNGENVLTFSAGVGYTF